MRRKMMDLKELLGGKTCLPSPALRLGERLLGFTTLNEAHYKIDEDWDAGSTENFFRLACKYLNLHYDLNEDELNNIPKEGACVIVSNHPHGFSDGIMFGDIALRVRPDIRIVVNEFLHCIFGMRPYSIQVDVYGGEAAMRANMASMRELLKWLRAGHCVLVFPSGSVSSYSKQDKRIIEEPWQTNIASIIRKTKAAVVPMNIAGRTSLFFQDLSVLCKDKRASFLPREIMRDGRMQHSISLGKAITPDFFSMTDTDEQLSDFLRLRSSLLSYERDQNIQKSPVPRIMQDIDPPIDIALQRADIAALPEDTIYYSSEGLGLCVYMARANQIPNLLKEIGIQREIIFRAVGEGTGNAFDLDVYDEYYGHLILWDMRNNTLVGAYRMGFTDEVIKKHGLQGLYTSMFYQIDDSIAPTLSQGIEMGRAFIKTEYQRLPNMLDTLWIGIGRCLAKNGYRYLYGLVSVSSDYSDLSRACILSFMKENKLNPAVAKGLKPRIPATGIGLRSEDDRLMSTAITSTKLLSKLVGVLEEDPHVGVPVLLKHYLRLDGQAIGFSLDPDFGNTLDCLILVDMANAPDRLKKRYLGEDCTLKYAPLS